jgi:cysteine desulfurase
VPTYLDHAASTPPRPEARAALSRWLEAANASAPHAAGQATRTAIEEARERIAAALGCSPHDVVFTSGGTEADNLTVKGVVWAARDRRADVPHVVTTAVEHPAVLAPARWLAERGDCRLDVVPSQPDGRVEVDRVVAAVREDTALVSVMTANNELGAVNDVSGLVAALADRGVPVHTDAVQAVATLDLDVAASAVAALSLSAHKFGGPQGVGVAVLRRGLPVEPSLHGGGQDRGVRSGTFATGLIAACGAGLTAAVADRPALRPRLRALTDRLAAGLLALDGVRRNGPTDPDLRLASHLHVTVDDVDPAALALALDRAEVAIASGAACGSGAATASPVLEACGIVGTPLRLSLGWSSTDADVDRALEVVTEVVPRLRSGRAAPVVG